MRFVFTDEKPMRGIDIYNKKVSRSPLTGSVPFVDTGFDIRTVYNLMTAIYQNGKYQGISSVFNYFVTELVGAGILMPGHILICDNAMIHLTQENRNLCEILWEQHKILVLNLPPHSPELNPIELVFQLLGQRLRHSNARYLSYQMQSEDYFIEVC